MRWPHDLRRRSRPAAPPIPYTRAAPGQQSDPDTNPMPTRSPSKTLLESPEFQRLVSRQWRMSLLLTALLFVLYYGYILLIATNKPLLARRVGEVVTLGIPLGVGVVVGAWALTAWYVIWANRSHDVEARRLRDKLHL
jgi:uncharacterized membrane protein (DUF485 family)